MKALIRDFVIELRHGHMDRQPRVDKQLNQLLRRLVFVVNIEKNLVDDIFPHVFKNGTHFADDRHIVKGFAHLILDIVENQTAKIVGAVKILLKVIDRRFRVFSGRDHKHLTFFFRHADSPTHQPLPKHAFCVIEDDGHRNHRYDNHSRIVVGVLHQKHPENQQHDRHKGMDADRLKFDVPVPIYNIAVGRREKSRDNVRRDNRNRHPLVKRWKREKDPYPIGVNNKKGEFKKHQVQQQKIQMLDPAARFSFVHVYSDLKIVYLMVCVYYITARIKIKKSI